MNVNQIYETIRPLPVVERLRLATLILNDISPQCIVDYNEEWSEEDYRDFNARLARYPGLPDSRF